MGGASQHAKSHAFMFTHAEDLHATIVAVFLILVWGIVYMTVINNRLYVYFNETVINSLLGIAMGIAVGSSGPLKSVTNFFLPWSNFANNILPFLIMYPASKLCSQSSRKKLRLSIAIAVLKTALCSLIISGSTVAYINTQSRVTFSGESNDRELNFHHIMYALHIGSSLSMYDTYLCVHNFPEFRDNTEIRGFLSSYGLASMSFALELSQMSVDLGHGPQPSLTTTITAVLKRVLFVPMVSAMLGVTAGLISSFVTKHSSFLHVQQEMVVLPCSNYISYTVAQKTGLSPVIT